MDSPGNESAFPSTRFIATGLAVASLAIWFGPAYAQLPDHGDTGYYLNYARAMFNGQIPWRDIGIEYPPLALQLFVVPYLFGRTPESYVFAFMTLMGMINASLVATTVTAVARAGRGRKDQLGAGALVAAAPALIGAGIALTRFDLWPTLLIAVGLLALARGQTQLAAGVLAAGAAAKIWPGLMLFPVLALAYRRGGRRELTGAVAMAVLMGGVPFAIALVIAGSGFIDSFEYHLHRPLQIETLGSSVLVSLWRFAGIGGPFNDEVSFGSFNLEGPGVGLVTTASAAASLSLILLANFLGARRVIKATDDDRAMNAAIRFGSAAVLSLVAFGKVMSPQFLLWLLPIPFLLRHARWATAGVLLGAMALTGLLFADYYRFVKEMEPLWTAILLVRNLLLAGLTIWLLIGWERGNTLAGPSSSSE